MPKLRTPPRGTAARLFAKVLLALGLLASFATASASPTALVIAATQAPLALLVHVADLQGLFAAEGVEVRTTRCAMGSQCLDRLFDKTAQFATLSELPVVMNSFTRNDFAIVATIGRNPQGIVLVGRRSAGIRAPADLRGKRVGVQRRSALHYFLDASLLFNGIDPKQVELVDIASPQLPTALAGRQIDAAALYAERASASLAALGGDAVLLEDPHLYTATVNLVVDRATLAARRADVVKVLRALARAGRWLTEQPAKVDDVLRARMENPTDAAAAVRKADFRLDIDQSLISTMEGEARWALREGHVKSANGIPNFLQFVDTGPLRDAGVSVR